MPIARTAPAAVAVIMLDVVVDVPVALAAPAEPDMVILIPETSVEPDVRATPASAAAPMMAAAFAVAMAPTAPVLPALVT